MNSTQRNNFRHMLMLVLYDAAPTSAAAERLMIGVKDYGFSLSSDEFAKELHFACEDELVKKEQATLSKGLSLYSLTPKGRDCLEESGLI